MHWPHPRIVAHRGGGTLAPENTLAAIRKSRSLGFAAVEFDVMLAADGVPVLIHDETLERTTTGSGPVARMDSGSLAHLDAGRWFAPEFTGETVPLFAEAAALCIELCLWTNVEIKPAKGAERATGRAVAALAAELWRNAPSAPFLSSFSVEALEAARETAPSLPRALLMGEISREWRERLAALACVSLHCDYRKVTLKQVESVREAGYALLCYTVNEVETARRLFAWGVDAIFTDRLDLFGPGFYGPP
ncbi:MAG: glycerophosphodiester phosphodiesterase [Betaproteobacteria bacterium]|nr:glycerophosphodiester phosphodiesterase [Betaproteobacteria bacterium]